MSKVLKVVAVVVGIAVFVTTGNPFLIALTVGALNALAGGPAKTKPQAQEARLQLGEIARRAWFGEAVAAGSLARAFNHGGQYGTDWETLVILLADHRCAALLGFYVGEKYVPFAGDGPVAGYNGQLEVYWRPGTETQSIPATLLANGGYGANDNSAGICYVVVAYKADKADAKNPVWPGGRPSFRWHMRGALLYDPRKDGTVPGGSGPHRWSDPSTREWSNNAELCRYNFDRGFYACDRIDDPRHLLVGRGLSAVEAPPERIFAAANLCDEPVALAAGGSEPRYAANGIIAADEEWGAVAEEFAKAMGGIVVQPEGGIAVEPGHAKAPVAYITDDDLIAGTKVTFAEFASEADEQWCNTVVARYTEPAQNWADHAAPVRRNAADVLADGGPRETSLSLRLVTSITQAQRVAEIRRRQGRLLKTSRSTLGPRFAELEEGDWIVWTSARRTGGQPLTFRIEGYRQGKDWRMELTLRQIGASVYGWSAADEIADGATAEAQSPPDGYGVPDLGSWSLSGGVVTGTDGVSLPALVFSGAVEDIYTDAVRFEYRPYVVGQAAGDGWIGAELAAPSVTERRITVAGGIRYEGAVSYRFPGGVPGERLILGPATAGAFASPGTVHTIVSYTGADFPISGSAETTITTNSIVALLRDQREIAIAGTTLTGLTEATYYGVFYHIETGVTSAAPYPATTQMASDSYIHLGWQSTQVVGGGSYPSTPTPPGGYGGGGRNPYEQIP